MEQENNEKETVTFTEGTETSSEATDNDDLEEVNEDETTEFEDDSEEGSHESEEEKSKKQSKEDNHRFAEMRRAREQAEREEKARKVEYDQTVESLECHDMLTDMVKGGKDNFSNHTKMIIFGRL